MSWTCLQIKWFLLFIFLFGAVVTDLQVRKIKNELIICFVLCGIMLNVGEKGLDGFFFTLKGMMLPLLSLFLFFILKILGAGDIKLFSGIGALMGAEFVLETMLYAFLTGGVMAAVLMLIRKNLRQRFRYLFSYLKLCFLTVSLLPYGATESTAHTAKFPFACAVFSGVGLQFLLLFPYNVTII